MTVAQTAWTALGALLCVCGTLLCALGELPTGRVLIGAAVAGYVALGAMIAADRR